METYIVIGVIIAILSGASLYIYYAKKKGKGCIGCSGNCSSCLSCNAEKNKVEKEKQE